MPTLVLVPAVHVLAEDGKLRADEKFLSGLKCHIDMWDGPVRVVLRVETGKLPFSRLVSLEELPGDVRLLDADEPFTAEHIAGADVVLGSGDRHDQMELASICANAGVPLVYAVEYTLSTRLRTAALDPQRKLGRRLKSVAWQLLDERRRRRAFREAAGLQFNGHPAQRAYGSYDPTGCLYFDGRMSRDSMATPAEMQSRAARLHAGRPIRLISSGRLEPMKGAQDLLPAVRSMIAAGVDFTLDIYGAGTLAEPIRAAIDSGEFADRVRLHQPVGFDAVLVPRMRQDADIFVSFHRQGDPSCSYIEAMGCGLAIIGTNNEMWGPMAAETDAGWTIPMGKPDEIAGLMQRLSANRQLISDAADRARQFADAHDFEQEFAHRMQHLAGFVGR